MFCLRNNLTSPRVLLKELVNRICRIYLLLYETSTRIKKLERVEPREDIGLNAPNGYNSGIRWKVSDKKSTSSLVRNKINKYN